MAIDKKHAADRKARLAKMSPQEKKVALSKERAERFQKLAPKFMDRALAAITRVSTLSKRSSYTYTDEQAAKILSALRSRVELVEKSFGSGGGAGAGFQL